jgi:hypothetical protein
MKALIWLSYCLSSAFDAGSTIYGARTYREMNPIIARGQGISLPRLIGLDGLGCAGAIYLRKRKHAYWLLAPAAVKTVFAVHNLRVATKEDKH